jgi:predicted site-specific integrase-resolvase
MSNNQKQQKCLLYVRASVDDQPQSISRQVQYLDSWALSRNMVVAGVITEQEQDPADGSGPSVI